MRESRNALKGSGHATFWLLLVLAVALDFTGCASAQKIHIDGAWIVAHRGASHLAPENTMASARLAWRVGADALECDVRQSVDGRIIVIHDADSLRTAGEPHLVSKTEWNRLKALDVGAHKGPKHAGESIPLLEDLLETVPEGRHVLIEVKTGPEILTELAEVLDRSGKIQQVVLMSFRLEVLALARRRWPEMPMIFLKKSELDFRTGCRRPHSRELFELILPHDLDGLGLDARGLHVDFVKEVKDSGLLLFVWTVDDPVQARLFRQAGVDALISNRPGWMKERLSE